jgi:hypothetical protein
MEEPQEKLVVDVINSQIIDFRYYISLFSNHVSIFGVKECDKALPHITQKLVKLLLCVELVSLIQCRIVIAHMLEYFVIEVVAYWGDSHNHSTYNNHCS